MKKSSTIIGFSKNNGLFSKLIRFFTGDDPSHCFILLPFNHPKFPDINMIFHAASLNVHYQSEENFLKSHKGQKILSLWEIEVSEDQDVLNRKMRFEEAGKKYGVLLIVGHLLKLFVKKIFKKEIKNPFSDGTLSHICVEICCRQLGLDSVAEDWTVGDLENYLKKSGTAVKIFDISGY